MHLGVKDRPVGNRGFRRHIRRRRRRRKSFPDLVGILLDKHIRKIQPEKGKKINFISSEYNQK